MAFSLQDYLGFETWLRESQPAAGASITSRALDFDRRQVVARRFTVKGRNTTGYQITNPAPLDATFIQLDDRLRPVAMTLSGLFQLEYTSKDQALAPRTALQAASYYVPTDRRLHNHTQIKTLSLEVTGAAASDLWPTLSTGNILHRQAGAVSVPRLLGDELRDTAEHPASDPRIHALARRAAGDADSLDGQVDALTEFVHNYLRYEEDGGRRHVLELLEQPRGDCNEHADLLTTLARSLGIPSRTVFGLAYAEDGRPAFRFHAWNEVLVGDTWRAVDPTWNQRVADATHIPMPGNVAYALELLTGGLDLSFTIRDVEYF
jgi:transglutaminase-like putative cysteine protease